MALKITDYLILIGLGGIAAVIVIAMAMPIMKNRLNVEGPKVGELARFIRYLGCSVIMCTKGCRTDEVVSHELEYENDKVVKSCKQLIDEYGYCNGQPTETKLCGKDYAISFTFNELTRYSGNYDVDTWNVNSYGTCGITSKGWQTDASCIGMWESDDYIESVCGCKRGKKAISGFVAVVEPSGKRYDIPDGVLFNYSSGGDCNVKTGTLPGYETTNYDNFVGSIWLPETFVDSINPDTGKPNCEVWESDTGMLKKCDFEENKPFWIWTDRNPQDGVIWEFDAWIFGHQKWVPVCDYGSTYSCPKLIVCTHYP